MGRFFFIAFINFFVACSETIKKNDNIIQIGRQTWMKNNLDVITFRNGDTIPEAKTDEEWEQARFAEKPAWCYFKNDPANNSKFGKLYNWYAVDDPRGLAPDGWHIPSDTEWTELQNCNEVKKFSIQPGGTRTFIGEYEKDSMGYWWSATGNESYDKQYAWYRVAGHLNDSLHRHSYVKGSGFSVRCIKNESK